MGCVRKRLRSLLGTAGLLALLTVGPVVGQERSQRVGQVLDIDGPRLMTDRLSQSRWYQAYAGMPNFLQERLKTAPDTYAMLEFAIGGRAGISPGTEIEIVTPRTVDVVGNDLRVKSGAFWASVDGQKRRVQIQTSGGVIGIEGTELLVNVDEETGVTEVLLFEGRARITENNGNEYSMLPGDYAEFGGSSSSCILSYPPSALRTVVVERFPKFSSFLAARGVTSIPMGAAPSLRRSHLSRTGTLETLIEQSQDGTVIEVEQVTLGAKDGETADWVYGMSPAQEKAAPGSPTFTWAAVPGASHYLFLLSSDAEMEELIFSSRPSGTSFQIPSGAPSIEAGRYHFRVIPLDSKGRIVGRASQTWFETEGWTSDGLELEFEASLEG